MNPTVFYAWQSLEMPVNRYFIRDALREALKTIEETGWDAARMDRLASGPPSAGVTSEVVTFLRARSLSRQGPGGGVDGEEIAVHEVPLDEVDAFLRAKEAEGALVDPKVWAGLFLLARP